MARIRWLGISILDGSCAFVIGLVECVSSHCPDPPPTTSERLYFGHAGQRNWHRRQPKKRYAISPQGTAASMHRAKPLRCWRARTCVRPWPSPGRTSPACRVSSAPHRPHALWEKRGSPPG
eukprot:3933092-Rhodomonas_salina.1